jgi:uncharacterized protein (DUF885 family)
MQTTDLGRRREQKLRRYCSTVLLCVTLICGSCSRSTDSGAALPVKAIADAYWDFWLRTNPEQATQVGEYRYNDQLSRYSMPHYEAVRTEASGLIARLKAIDAARLNASDRLDHAVLLGTLEDLVRSIDLKMYEMPVDQFYGVQIAIPQIAMTSPFDTVKQYEDYIARMRQVPERLEQLTATMRQGVKDKLMPPKYLIEKTVVQCRNIADPGGEKSPFAAPVLRFPDTIPADQRKRLHDTLLSVVDGEVRPAYKKLEQFIAKEYAPQGRVDEGYWSLPDGDERYRFNVHTQTTSNVTPEQIHQLGLAQVADLEAQISALAKTAVYPDGKTFTKAVYADSKLKAANREQILDSFRNYIANMEPKLPQLFGRLPKGKLLVTSVPEYMEKDS